MTETSTVDAKIIRDRGGLSKGYGFVDMRNDDVGEEQTKELLRRKFLYLRSQKIVFKPAYRKSLSSQVIDILSLVFDVAFVCKSITINCFFVLIGLILKMFSAAPRTGFHQSDFLL